ncbi:MAG: winged helix-turn-helix domain-containing protein [Candidatus Omnitrophica bacterium]|nr:winged helix-turn-helix domain-containing protein [Candidatus Omnitrophota bacterium]
MITRIGLVAGDIWNYLDNNHNQETMENLITALGKDRSYVLMSIGWLAREGHVTLEGDGPNFVVKLAKPI